MATRSLKSVGDELQAIDADGRRMMPNYEAWRPALISFYRVESPWMTQKRENLERGDQLTNDDRRIIDALIVAVERAPERQAA